MSLTDLMSGAQLDNYAQFSLILFLLAFLIVVVRLFSRRNDATFQRAAHLPLEDDITSHSPPDVEN